MEVIPLLVRKRMSLHPNRFDDELTNSKLVDDVIVLTLLDVFPSSTFIALPC